MIGDSDVVPSGDFSTSRGHSAVLLNRRDEVTGPTGLFTCRVLDSRGVVQSLYIGVYGVTGGTYEIKFMLMWIFLGSQMSLYCYSGHKLCGYHFRKENVFI